LAIKARLEISRKIRADSQLPQTPGRQARERAVPDAKHSNWKKEYIVAFKKINVGAEVCAAVEAATRALVLAAVIVSVAACSQAVDKPEEARPVRVMVARADTVGVDLEFSGEVRPRIESRLGFRVGGKIVSRQVDVGSSVKRGQLLMQLDPQDLKLAQTQANASLRAAETNRDVAKADLARYRDLRAKNFVSQAVLDAKESAFTAAQANVDASAAAYKGQANQAAYAQLLSDVDGVVTGIEVEVGQVVGAGTPVVRVAKRGEREIVIGLPEDQVDTLRKVETVEVRLWAHPDTVIKGRIRELSPVADAATRTYAAKIAIADSAADAKLGMTALVRFSSRSPSAMIKVPLTALFHEKDASAVWIVEHGAVKLVPVQTAGVSGNDVLLSKGVTPGQTIVTAGVHLLKVGQKVTILGDDGAPPAVPAARTGAAGTAK